MGRVAGIIEVKADGEIYPAKGNWTFNLGKEKRESIIGSDRFHGHKAMPQVAFIEGTMTYTGEFDLEQILNAENVTVTLRLANGKTVILNEAFWAADGNVTTEDAELDARFEGSSAQIV